MKPKALPKAEEPFWFEYMVNGMCGLCGNCGMIGPLHTLSPRGDTLVLTPRPCICSNGRAVKCITKQGGKKK